MRPNRYPLVQRNKHMTIGNITGPGRQCLTARKMSVRPWPSPRGNPVVYVSMSLKEWHNILRGCKNDKHQCTYAWICFREEPIYKCTELQGQKLHGGEPGRGLKQIWYIIRWLLSSMMYPGQESECYCNLPLKVLYLLFWKQKHRCPSPQLRMYKDK